MITTDEAESLIVAASKKAYSDWCTKNDFSAGEDEAYIDRHGHTRWGVVSENIYGQSPIAVDGYTLEERDRFGGEGQGDAYGHVYSLSDGVDTQYFKLHAYYSSWNGVDWEEAELYEVEPFEVVRTEWRTKR